METKEIYKAMADIMTDAEAIAKNRKNTQQNYQFRGIDDVYNMLHDVCAKHRVFILPELVGGTREERATKDGKGVLISAILDYKFTFVHADGSSVTAGPIRGEGMDSGDKSSNKAATSAMKTCLLQVFLIPTEESKDSENDNPEPAPKDARLEKIKALPDNIKEGFRLLDWKLNRAFDACEANGWDHEKIMTLINRTLDGQVKS